MSAMLPTAKARLSLHLSKYLLLEITCRGSNVFCCKLAVSGMSLFIALWWVDLWSAIVTVPGHAHTRWPHQPLYSYKPWLIYAPIGI